MTSASSDLFAVLFSSKPSDAQPSTESQQLMSSLFLFLAYLRYAHIINFIIRLNLAFSPMWNAHTFFRPAQSSIVA